MRARTPSTSPLSRLAAPEEVPAAVERLGAEIFVTAKMRPIPPDEIELVFFNRDIAARLGVGCPEGFEALEGAACEAFGLDVDEHGPRVAWVDRQRDPLGIAMNGNLGSGRAVYVGRCVNLKGVGRTPLAAAPEDSEHGHGFVDIVDAAWECVASDVFFFDADFGTAPALALLRRRRPRWIKTEFESGAWETAIVARLDGGALDRPTHLFVPGVALRVSLLEMTRAFARQEAEKITLGVVHGAFSAGNVSVNGHILDMDTVRAVLGRNPHYSRTGCYLTNTFGSEWRGALRILESLAASERNNPDHLSMAAIRAEFSREYGRWSARKSLHLFGVPEEDVERVLERHPEEVRFLASELEALAEMTFPDLRALYTEWAQAPRVEVFDASRFLRGYHRVRAVEPDLEARVAAGLGLLRRAEPRFELVENPFLSEAVREHLRREHTVEDPDHLAALERRAREFVRRFDAFADALERALLGAASLVERTYVLNEERPYLSGYGHRWLAGLLAARSRGEIDRAIAHRCVEAMARASRRRSGNTRYGLGVCTDLRVFKEGVVGRVLGGAGEYRYFFEAFDEGLAVTALCVDLEVLPLERAASVDGPVWISRERSVLQIPEVAEFEVRSGDEPLVLEGFCEREPRIAFALVQAGRAAREA